MVDNNIFDVMEIKRKLFKLGFTRYLMDSEIANVKIEDLTQLIRDVGIIKNILLSEGELSDWAKNELAKVRKTPETDLIKIEEIEKEFFSNVV